MLMPVPSSRLSKWHLDLRASPWRLVLLAAVPLHVHPRAHLQMAQPWKQDQESKRVVRQMMG